ncbi:TPA: fimbrial protein [Serratia fonticola]|uniref:fimbrial protein n=1 Tax=Serratia fonticola TaxID=47917 RepID=UPI00217A3B9B|nr:fimbrial protein [Serratia fonticola]CAI1543109.1 PAP fimbrial minor pilin protein precursor [Serratia fonticola]CAI1731360.1 PAP fimbrial minor pilin protein precursor [Serratia fonticola]CAI1995883.1 PAP fimbrial minor pilin protein precursor [Serratia fonticola]CAI2002294.1 PAP fimbrial minor pilin protein precursor [Serratia fonticola]
MQFKTGKGSRSRQSRHEWQYWLTQTAAVLMVPLVIGVGFSLLPSAWAVDNWSVDGANGVLHVHGALTESACRLDMTSAWQEVDLGEVSTGRLRKMGDHGTPVAVRLKLQDCLPGPSRSLDTHTGNRLWSADQPAVTVSFSAPADADNPQLVKVQGAGGLGLRLTDVRGRDVRLGSRGAPLLLTPGQNELTYHITPERTRAPLQAGAYWAQMNFGLSYD